MSSKREAYEKKFDAQLSEWSAQIALLRAKADNAKADANLDYHKTIETLQRKRDEAAAKYHELKSSGDEAWEDVKKGAERAWDDVKTAYHEALSNFK